MSKVGVIMGSKSDLPVMQDAVEILRGFDIEVEVDIVSAHRTPDRLYEYSKTAHARCIGVIIAGAGGAAHLPGMVASLTHLPVLPSHYWFGKHPWVGRGPPHVVGTLSQ